MEVYIFQGNEGEQVPETVEKLIVEEGVQVLPDQLCYEYERLQEVTLPNGLIRIGMEVFYTCKNLLEISIPSTVKFIGEGAFSRCNLLTKVDFEFSTSSPHRLQTIDSFAFDNCDSLRRINLPSSVNSIGQYAFEDCLALIEANLSTTCVTEIWDSAFAGCSSLQTVSLPNTVGWIDIGAFDGCSELVTVVVPLDSRSIKIGKVSFYDCERLANLLLPKDSTTEEDSFEGCTLLHQRYGEDSSRIVAGLISRFDELPAHRMCYDNSSFIVQELRRCIADQQEGVSLVDKFGMTPFHVLFSAVDPNMKLLKVLLDSLPNQMLKWKDANDKTPLEYLINNWSDGTVSLLQRTFQKWMIDPLARWGDMKCAEAMKAKVGALLFEHDKDRRLTLLNGVCFAFVKCENIASTSILELALWKGKLKSGWTNDGSKRQALDREECRCLCGSDVVIPSITGFLFD